MHNISYQHAAAWLTDHYPMIAAGLLFNDKTIEPIDQKLAEQVLTYYLNKVGPSEVNLIKGLTAFSQISFDFIKLQSRFLKTGQYRSCHAQPIIEQLYLNPSHMEGYYLDGLFLSYAFWSNHTRMLRFFVDAFLSQLAMDSSVMEIGVGHGLMALLTLSRLDRACYTGMDMSPSALIYAHNLLISNGISDKARLLKGDATVVEGKGEWNAVICCEVLEHVEAPEKILALIRRSLLPHGIAFITTVANIEAEDHIYLFKSDSHIRAFIQDNSFSIQQEWVLPLKGTADSNTVPLNYAAIIKTV